MTTLTECPNCEENLVGGSTRCWVPGCDYVVPWEAGTAAETAETGDNGETGDVSTVSIEAGREIEEILAPDTEWIVVEKENGGKVAHSGKDAFSKLRKEITKGEVKRDSRALHLPAVVNDDETARKAAEWGSFRETARKAGALDRLYRPVWACTCTGALIGTITGIALKYLDTTITMFAADDTVGFIWLALTGCLVASSAIRFLMYAPLILCIVCARSGIGISILALFGATLSTTVVGVLFGLPIGAVLGTIVGYIRKSSADQARDADHEGMGPLVWGFIVPLAAAVAWVYAYFVIILPWIYHTLDTSF